MKSDEKSRHDPLREASKIYLLPNILTAGNLFFGFVAIILCIQAREHGLPDIGAPARAAELYTQAVFCILLAVICDALDGRVARLGGRESQFGKEFDSLADMVSFGLAPALLVFFLILSPTENFPFFQQVGWLLGFVYLLCAGVRLARFNVISSFGSSPLSQNPKHFIGLPAPAAAGIIASLALVLNTYELNWWAVVLPFLMLLIAYLMVSSIAFPSFKNIDWNTHTRVNTFILVIICVVLIFSFREIAFALIFLGYTFYGVLKHLTKKAPAGVDKL